METRSKATRDLALSDDVIPSAEFSARTGESTPASGDLGYIKAAGIVGDSRPSSTRPPTEIVSPHMSIHEGDIDGPPQLQRADLAPCTSSSLNPCPPTIKLMERLIPSNKLILVLLERWFSLSVTCVKWCNLLSTTYSITCGIRQRVVLSPYLFAIYNYSLVLKSRDMWLWMLRAIYLRQYIVIR